VKDLETLLQVREGLQAKGMATSDRVLEVRERSFAARESISRATSEIVSVDAALLSLRSRNDQELAAFDRQLRDSQGQREQIRLVEGLATTIQSRVDGTVVANEVSQYAMVSAGQKLMVIERGDTRLEALLYVAPESGKEIHPGMEVRLSPSFLKKEEYGTLIGTVIDIDKAPESQAALADLLGNPDLAREFTRDGPPLQVVVRLEERHEGAGDYAWTSRRGQGTILHSLTLLSGQVTIKTGRPIGLFIPAFRRWVGL
jgi:NHLM bacteriocin system secretion protein